MHATSRSIARLTCTAFTSIRFWCSRLTGPRMAEQQARWGLQRAAPARSTTAGEGTYFASGLLRWAFSQASVLHLPSAYGLLHTPSRMLHTPSRAQPAPVTGLLHPAECATRATRLRSCSTRSRARSSLGPTRELRPLLLRLESLGILCSSLMNTIVQYV